MIVLQELLFPKPDLCPMFEMYFRTDDAQKHAYADHDAGLIRVPRWCTLDLSTYFNSFSVGKWRKYTRLENLSLRLELSGAFRVQLLHWHRLREKTYSAVLAERVCSSDERKTFAFSFPGELPARGVFGCALYALGEDNAFYGGAYTTDAAESALNPVDIALDICTFRREPFIERNIAMLNEDILRNPGCELAEHLEVFISDNGRTLDVDRLADDRVHVFPNRNVGGAGGFTRGMIEIIDSPRRFSHALLMDDDVLISSDALVRTYRVLRLMKPEYAGKTVAGALMRLDNRHIQYESGARWDGVYPTPLKHNRDMRRIDNVLKNEQEETVDYNGWWYCCIPMSKVTGDNLPLPVFVHRDDIEYGYRTGSDFLLMNGICLWHDSFDNKYAASMEYYEMRNDMILNALHMPGVSGVSAAVILLKKVVSNLVRYRYDNCDLVLKGLDDFCAGPEYLMNLDPEALHRWVLSKSVRPAPVEQLDVPFEIKQYKKSLPKHKNRLNRLRVFTLNGLLLPGRGTGVAGNGNCWPRNFYRKDAVLNYDELTHQGFVTRRDRKRALAVMAKTAGKMFALARNYRRVAETYRRSLKDMASRDRWDRYLGLK